MVGFNSFGAYDGNRSHVTSDLMISQGSPETQSQYTELTVSAKSVVHLCTEITH